ncbi:C-mannosyltransferase dpy-19 [Zophobas morio]|uniref:C-mannosyltransferase dpy-19 n=1 Tax=Zophobas morio TaxID=2755281 RepID=UPI003082A651
MKKTLRFKEKESWNFEPAIIILCFSIIWSLCFWYLNHVHEERTWWSTRTLDQKESFFISERALYYTYYKESSNASIAEVFNKFLKDDTVEYPDVINSIRRFNIWPEIALAFIYRNFWPLVTTSEVDFYIKSILFFQSLTPASVFAIMYFSLRASGISLLNLMIASFLSVLGPYCCFLTLTTRVFIGPGLREMWGVPLFFLSVQQTVFLMTHPKMLVKVQLFLLFIIRLFSLLSWQLLPSVFGVETCALLAAFLFGHLSYDLFRNLVFVKLASNVAAAVLMFGNNMFLASLDFCVLLSFSLLITSRLLKIKSSPSWKSAASFVFATAAFAFLLRLFLTGSAHVTDDSHLFSLLLSKLNSLLAGKTSERPVDFYSALYLLSGAFQFMDTRTLKHLCRGGLLPLAVCSVSALIGTPRLKNVSHHAIAGPLYYLAFFGLGITCSALLVKRLSVLWLPFLGLFSSYFMFVQLFLARTWRPPEESLTRSHLRSFLSTLLGLAIIILYAAESQWFHELRRHYTSQGAFDLITVRELCTWIRKHTPEEAVFAGDMSTMASVRLMGRRRVVNHPHFETPRMRHRTFLISHWFSRRLIKDVHKILKDLQVEYFVNHHPPCYRYASYEGQEILDLGEKGYPPMNLSKSKIRCCAAVADPNKRKGYFALVRNTKDFPVYKVL